MGKHGESEKWEKTWAMEMGNGERNAKYGVALKVQISHLWVMKTQVTQVYVVVCAWAMHRCTTECSAPGQSPGWACPMLGVMMEITQRFGNRSVAGLSVSFQG